MEVDYLVLADAATAVEGKHYIHGAGWDTLYALNYPVTHPLLAVALRFKVPWNETNQPHRLQLDVLNADGGSILPDPSGPVQGEINVGRPPTLSAGDDQYIALVLNLVGIRFPQPGTYVVAFQLDGTEAKRTTFRVVTPPGIQHSPAAAS